MHGRWDIIIIFFFSVLERTVWPFQLSTMDKRLGSSRFKSLDCGSPLAVVGFRTLIYPTPSGGMTMQPLIPEPQGGKGTWERWRDPQTTCTGWGNGSLSKGERIRRKIQVDPWQSRSGASENAGRKGAAPAPKLLSPCRGNHLCSLCPIGKERCRRETRGNAVPLGQSLLQASSR